MSVRVQDFRGNEIKVGTRVMYGCESPAVVIAISDPDIYSHDDDYGREIVDGYQLEITVRFDDGSTDILRARDVTVRNGPPEYWNE